MGEEQLPPPFGGVAPHFEDADSGVEAWFLDPPGMLTRVAGHDAIDLPVARCLTGPLWREVEALGRARGATRYTIVHDWTSTRSYAANARNLLTTWCLDHRGELERAIVVVSPLGPVVSAGVKLAQSLLAVAGLRLELAESLDEVIAREHLTPLASYVHAPVSTGAPVGRARP